MDLLALVFEAAFVAIAMGAIVAVARAMRADALPVDPEDDERVLAAAALVRAVVPAFLLMSFGAAALVLATGAVADDVTQAIQALSRRVGVLLLVIGALHRGASMLSARLVGGRLEAEAKPGAFAASPRPDGGGEAEHGALAALRTALWAVVIVLAVVALQPVALDLPGSLLLGVVAIGGCVAAGRLAIDVAGRALRAARALDAPAILSVRLVSHGAVALSCGLGMLPADGAQAVSYVAARIGVVLLVLGALPAAALIVRVRASRPEVS